MPMQKDGTEVVHKPLRFRERLGRWRPFYRLLLLERARSFPAKDDSQSLSFALDRSLPQEELHAVLGLLTPLKTST
jgi:hypothetical protein